MSTYTGRLVLRIEREDDSSYDGKPRYWVHVCSITSDPQGHIASEVQEFLGRISSYPLPEDMPCKLNIGDVCRIRAHYVASYWKCGGYEYEEYDSSIELLDCRLLGKVQRCGRNRRQRKQEKLWNRRNFCL